MKAIARDTRLTGPVLESLGFERQPPEPGGAVPYLLRRYGQPLTVRTDAAPWGQGWDLDGMKPADIGDLLVMLFLYGANLGRRETLHAFLDVVGVTPVAEWLALIQPPAPPAVSAAPKKARGKVAGKKPVSKKPATKRRA